MWDGVEVWCPVRGLERFYEVSCRGRVRSLPRLLRNRGGQYVLNGCVLKQRKHPFGYPMVTMSAENKRFHRTVHSLVAEAFLGPRPDGLQVCHRDGVVWNCALENLRYDTPGANSMDRLDHETFPMGPQIHSAGLTEAQIVEIRNRRAAGESNKTLAAAFGQSEVNISKIVTGAKWSRAPGPITRSNKKQVRLSDETKQAVRQRHAEGETFAALARAYGVSETQIKNAVKA